MTLRKTVRSRRLGKLLRQLREDAQLSQDDLVALVNTGKPPRRLTTTHLSRVETGLARLIPDHLTRIVAATNASQDRAAELEELRRRADERGWWQEYRAYVPEPVEMLAELGEDATGIRSYDIAFVQGLLQTRAYAEAVVGAARAHVLPVDVDRLVELRMRRQQRLRAPDFGRLVAVMTEGVIRTVVGGPEVMREQLRHLIAITEALPVSVHVLPFSAGALPGPDSLVIFTFSQEGDGEAVFVDSDTASRIYEDRDRVTQCTYTFSAALAQALSARDSLALINQVMKEL
ncbi:Helix-turn-helix domain-containing protein [Streptoalloteichus tenebrarius]|uniref:Helix-turn-helix domain-containing protein n=1 Tax=Streptoalloteichus tenebrarius (strain ATCC 17920 / DSM 40477 / JCM 4838 / CBS 697.72 / NBRC 16177 / NCIMB 11028 / NRRL B-12390 / A12253. 1 / ISP 5477) TaxID=1933 RepID=A0ABT1HMD3_STRSD|nr:helix-turn-helix transcriptional regulator [Streptoalloteichus tenebrarius]MCP2256663.1 Helix-turn-helix domain-containing protein [Streptoalloteichus tenebrarius]BFF05017.1 helix-turn-helix transcriptional regulator [Streptoalloteichus tenebrarius]